MRIFRALMIHGVGQQTNRFADDARQGLRDVAKTRDTQVRCLQAHWAPLADRAQARYLKRAEAHGSRGNASQRLVIGTLSDALMYRNTTELQKQIFYILDQQEWLLGEPFTIFAHSLGGLIATDWLRSRPDVRNVRLVTFGCNIGLFTLGSTFDCPEQLKKPGSWVNFYYDSDLLGFPLAVDPALGHVEDIKLRRRFWTWSRIVGGLTHLDYWTDSRFWEKVIPKALNM